MPYKYGRPISKRMKFAPGNYWDGAGYARLRRPMRTEDKDIIPAGTIGRIVGHGTNLITGREDFSIDFPGRGSLNCDRSSIRVLRLQR